MKQLGTFLLLLLVTLSIDLGRASAQQSIFDSASDSFFSNDDEFLPVDEAFSFEFFQRGNQLDVSFTIAPGYYLYRHQFKATANNALFTPLELPPGTAHEDEFFGIQQVFTDDLNFNITINQAGDNADISVSYQGCAEKGLCYPPTSKTVPLSTLSDGSQNAVLAALMNQQSQSSASAPLDNKAQTLISEQHQLADMLKSDSLVLTLVAFFIGGLLLSLTPCVFPMYPILTSIIVGQGKQLTTKKAFFLSFAYVQGMAVTYTALGIVVALAGAQFQAMFQHPAVLIGLSVLFIVLALSMFGAFNLALPSRWQNKLNDISNKQKGGSFFSVLLMGAISGLVASPCTTAPLTGALLYISQTGDVVLGAAALYALSIGMGLPLLILGSSGGKLLPQAGNWMTVIKNVFGLLLLAVPVFLLERFISPLISELLWVALILSSATYFFVVNQSTSHNFWYGVRSLLIFLALFIGANQGYQLITPTQVYSGASTASLQQPAHAFKRVANLAQLMTVVNDANAQGKTVMVDFYADWCIACKEFEKYTFPQPKVQQALHNTLLVQIDLTDFETESSIELKDRFDIFGLPSILFFDLQGNELTRSRITGFMEAQQFAQHVTAIF
jgi:thiol:disulfide interchange protein DsbD